MYLAAGIERTAEIEEIIRQKSKRKANIELQEKVLEYCKEPRTMKEIMAYLNMTCPTNVAQRVLRPLMHEGKLRLRYKKNGSNQQYINAEVPFNYVTETSILEYCKTPRLVKEIREHFDMTQSVYVGMIRPLKDAGKLV
ncbi:MAG: hypothetical protein FWE62_01545, partial [Firmicutes bacterium]|nr:hypothetical protein [Bacillota bacterium]